MISEPALPSIVSSAVKVSVGWKVNVSSPEEPTNLRLPTATASTLILVVINDLPAVSSPEDKVPAPEKLNLRPGLAANTASLIVRSLPSGIVRASTFEIVANCVATRFIAAPKTTVSVPAPPSMISDQSVINSVLEPRLIISLPAPPEILSIPPLPSIVSIPPPPSIVSFLVAVVRISAPPDVTLRGIAEPLPVRVKTSSKLPIPPSRLEASIFRTATSVATAEFSFKVKAAFVPAVDESTIVTVSTFVTPFKSAAVAPPAVIFNSSAPALPVITKPESCQLLHQERLMNHHCMSH